MGRWKGKSHSGPQRLGNDKSAQATGDWKEAAEKLTALEKQTRNVRA